MNPFVLDASVAISWRFPNDLAEDTPYSRQILGLLESRDAIVPGIWGYEVANSLDVSYSRRSRIDERRIQRFLALLNALPIRMERQALRESIAPESPARAWNVAAYDAAYLELASRLNLPIATTDQKLREIALSAGIELL